MAKEALLPLSPEGILLLNLLGLGAPIDGLDSEVSFIRHACSMGDEGVYLGRDGSNLSAEIDDN